MLGLAVAPVAGKSRVTAFSGSLISVLPLCCLPHSLAKNLQKGQSPGNGMHTQPGPI